MKAPLLQCNAEGVKAFTDGQPMTSCPFAYGSEERNAWNRGYATARFGATFGKDVPRETKIVFARGSRH